MYNKNRYKMGTPLQIGKMTVKNRIVFPPMNTNLTSENGCVTPEMEEYYVRRAKGGAGLIVLEAAVINGDTKNHPGQPVLYDRAQVAGWAHLVERLHRYDARVGVELVHYGSEASMLPRESPSGLSKYKDEPGTVLTKERIKEIQLEFVNSAKLARQAGMDCITLHACHGYLLAEFLSPVFNQRTDEYGGSFENRCRFLLETLDLCRKELGPNFPIFVRYSANEFILGGREMEECVELAKVLEEHGVDAVDISAGQPSAYLMTTPPNCLEQGKKLLVPYSAAIKRVVKVPVFTAIGIREPEDIEEILVKEEADLVCLGRPQLADPDYVNKALNGETDQIRHCLSCEFCLDTLDDDRRICCAVNPETGREREYNGITKAEVKKRVIVIGGGPAGMEAARVSKIRGHEVILFDKNPELGGTLNAAKVPPHKEMIGRLVEWYKLQLKELDVDIRLNEEITEEALDAMKPDAVFLAAGAHYIKRIKGSDGPNVIDAVQALQNPSQVGKRIVIVGGGASGAETADYFSGASMELSVKGAKELGGEVLYDFEQVGEKSNKEIAIVEMLPEICSDMDVFCKEVVLSTLQENGVSMNPSCRVDEITEEGVRAFDMKGEKELFFPADTVILAGGLRSNYENGFAEKSYPVLRIGDAIRVGKIKDAIYTAYYKACEI